MSGVSGVKFTMNNAKVHETNNKEIKEGLEKVRQAHADRISIQSGLTKTALIENSTMRQREISLTQQLEEKALLRENTERALTLKINALQDQKKNNQHKIDTLIAEHVSLSSEISKLVTEIEGVESANKKKQQEALLAQIQTEIQQLITEAHDYRVRRELSQKRHVKTMDTFRIILLQRQYGESWRHHQNNSGDLGGDN